jgi:hypothetical protein
MNEPDFEAMMRAHPKHEPGGRCFVCFAVAHVASLEAEIEKRDNEWRAMLHDSTKLEAERDAARHSADAVHKQASDNARRASVAEARVVSLTEALEESEKGIGSMLWVLNNTQNAGTTMFERLVAAAQKDGRVALSAARAALASEEGEPEKTCGDTITERALEHQTFTCTKATGHTDAHSGGGADWTDATHADLPPWHTDPTPPTCPTCGEVSEDEKASWDGMTRQLYEQGSVFEATAEGLRPKHGESEPCHDPWHTVPTGTCGAEMVCMKPVGHDGGHHAAPPAAPDPTGTPGGEWYEAESGIAFVAADEPQIGDPAPDPTGTEDE